MGAIYLITQRSTDQGHQDARAKVATGRPFQTGTCVIIISESSAEGTQPVRTDRYTPARRRSSAAGNDTPRHADARPVSVH
jgi:hypothetical protein